MGYTREVGPLTKPELLQNYRGITPKIKLIDDTIVDWLKEMYGEDASPPTIKDLGDTVSVKGVNDLQGNSGHILTKGDYVVRIAGIHAPVIIPKEAVRILNKITSAKQLFFWNSYDVEVLLVAPKFYYWDAIEKRFQIECMCAADKRNSKAFFIEDEADDKWHNFMHYDAVYHRHPREYKGYYDKVFTDAHNMIQFLNYLNVPDRLNPYIKLLEAYYE